MVSALPLASGDFGTWMTLRSMRGMVLRQYLLPIVRLTATQIVAGLGGKDGVLQAEAIRRWVDNHVEFLRDPDGAEMLHGPSWQLDQINIMKRVYVDCDDVAMLAAALGKSIGLRARFVVVAFDYPNAPYRHVWTELAPINKNVWTDVDITRPSQGLPFDRITRSTFVYV